MHNTLLKRALRGRGQAAAAGEGEGDRDPVRDWAQRHAGRRRDGPRAGRRGGGEPGLPAAGPRRGLHEAVVQDEGLLPHRRRHLGRRLLRQGRRRRPPQPGYAGEPAGEIQDAPQGVRRMHEVRACSVAKVSRDLVHLVHWQLDAMVYYTVGLILTCFVIYTCVYFAEE
jgi:hypothetical protein